MKQLLPFSCFLLILLQPSFMWTSRYIKIIFSLRWSGMVYTHIQSDFSPGIALKGNKLYLFGEPAMTYIFTPNFSGGLAFRVQLGAAIPQKDLSFEIKPFIGNVGITAYPEKWFQSRKKSGMGLK